MFGTLSEFAQLLLPDNLLPNELFPFLYKWPVK